MGLFNIDNILEMADNNYVDNTFEKFTYQNMNFLETATAVSNNLRKLYQNANINLHRNSIENQKVKYSDFYIETSTILNEVASTIKNISEKALEQYSHYSKEYNLAELSLNDKIFTIKTPAKLNHIHNYTLKSIAENFKESLPLEICSAESLKESIAICKRDGKDVVCGLRTSYGTDSFDVMYMDKKSDITSSNFIEYLDNSYFGNNVEETFNVPVENIVSYARKINNDDLTDAVVGEFNSVFEDMQIGASAISGLVDNEISSEAIPYLSTTEEEVKGLKNVYTNLNISQFIESVCTAIIAAGYKADVLFENLMIYRDVCDKAESRVQSLKEQGKIDIIDIFLAETAMEEE